MPIDDDDEANTFRILFATDIHLGFCEREEDPIRRKDSLVAFEEILEKAQKNNVDFVLLGGNLFHENKPSRRTMHDCLTLLRKYCMGDKPVQFECEFLSDESVNIEHCQFPTLNFKDSNFKISIPVFSIHGNRDDPTGPGNLCSLDIIHSAGLINYFGKTTSLENIHLSPLLMQKGSTKLALYGLGALRDERFHHLFLNKNVSMPRPPENQDDWFNMLVLHQNRFKQTSTNCLPEQFLYDFLDLVLWGHEHECRIKLEHNDEKDFDITQPGSSIVTSRSKGETVKKHIGLLQVQGKICKVTPIPLQTVRQFYLENIVLADTSLDPSDLDVGNKVEAFCRGKVKALIEKAESERSGSQKQPKEPLINLKIDHTGFDTFSTRRFGRLFTEEVANHEEIIDFHQKRKLGTKENSGDGEDLELLSLDIACVEDMVKKYFSKVDADNQLQLLREKGMSEAVREFVVKEEKEAVSERYMCRLQKIQKYLLKCNTNEEAIVDEVSRYKEHEESQEALKQAQSLQEANPDEDSRMDLDSATESTASTSGRGRGWGRGRGRGTGALSSEANDDDDLFQTQGKRTRGRGKGCGKTPVVMETGSQGSVKDMSVASDQRQASKCTSGKVARYNDDSEDDDGSIISDEDDDFGAPAKRQKQTKNGSGSSSNRESGNISNTSKHSREGELDSDTDEEDYFPDKKEDRC